MEDKTTNIKNKPKCLEDFITNQYLCKLCHPDYPIYGFTDEAIGLIKFYLRPFLKELDTITNYNFINIINTYPKELQEEIYLYNDLNSKEPGNYSYSLSDIRESILEHIIYFIIYKDNNDILDDDSPEEITNIPITVWDICYHFNCNNNPRSFFGTTSKDKLSFSKCLVDVNTPNEIATKLNRDLVIGILTFYKAFELQHPLSCYGGIFTHEMSEISPLLSGDTNKDSLFTCELNSEIYGFNSKKCLRGLFIASKWVNNNICEYQVYSAKLNNSISIKEFI